MKRNKRVKEAFKLKQDLKDEREVVGLYKGIDEWSGYRKAKGYYHTLDKKGEVKGVEILSGWWDIFLQKSDG